MSASIRAERLMRRINEFREIGKDPGGGLTRPFGSEADLEARSAFRRAVL